MARILCISAQESTRTTLAQLLFALGHESHGAADPEAALARLRSHGADLVVLDPEAEPAHAAALVTRLHAASPGIAVVVLVGHGAHEAAMAARRAGAMAHVRKPVLADELELAVVDVMAHTRLVQEHAALRRTAAAHEAVRVFGDSAPARTLLASIRTAALTLEPLLLVGEPGSGRAFAARAIHAMGPRRDGPFVSVECATHARDHAEALLLERAGGGTLLLRGIDTVDATLRRRLAEASAGARLIATTARDDFAGAAELRDDPLRMQLAVLPIRVPPLRERRADIPLLADAIARRIAAELGKPYDALSQASLALLTGHDWPANVQELRDAVAEAVVAATAPTLEPHHFAAARFGETAAGAASGIHLPSLHVARAERHLIAEALHRTGGNRTRAAALLGMSVRTLRHKLNTKDGD